MISRRNIRVKVMQALYATESQDESLSESENQLEMANRLLERHFDLSRQLLVYLIHFITEIARYPEAYARQQATKHLPSQEDLNVNTKICGNELLLQILGLPSWKDALKRDKPQLLLDKELLRKLYLELITREPYLHYMSTEERNRKAEKAMLEYIFQEVLLPSESFLAHVEELFTNWEDDAEMMVLLINNFFNKFKTYHFSELLSEEKRAFAFTLLRTVIEKKALTLDYIKPKLKNWDPDRIAVLDMILMRMGVCEFLYFETIPPKVTINEYIDLAKDYSTPQSGHFVNGILDNIHKELVHENKMHKKDFKHI